MLLHLTDLSEEPLHSQISRQLVDRILDGELTEGTKLESSRMLARTQRVSINTVKRAYEDLERDGLIQATPGQGFLVAALTPAQKRAINRQRTLGNQSLLNVVEIFSRQLISVFDPERLRSIIEDNLKNCLFVNDVYFIIHDDRTNEYTLLPSQEHPTKFVIPGPDNLLRFISRLKLPMPIEKIQVNIKDSPLAEALNRRRVRMIVPLKEVDQFLGFLALSGKITGTKYTREELNLVSVLANQFVTALTTARFYVEALEKRRMKEELKMAHMIQAGLLPKNLPEDDHFSLAACSIPSRMMGGDFYDVMTIDDQRCGLMIGDACGKGLPAALLIAQIQAMMKSEVNNGNSITTVLRNINNQAGHFPKNRFVTLFYGVYNKDTGEVDYATAGHHQPIQVRKNGTSEFLGVGGPAIGLLHNASYQTAKINLRAGDVLFLYTDGVTETMNADLDEYGDQRLHNALVRNRHLDARGIINAILDDLDSFSAGQPLRDDRSMLVLKVN